MIWIPGIILGTLIFNRYWLRTGVLIALWFQTIGVALKLLSLYHYSFLFIGQTIWVISNIILSLAPSLMAVTWFEDSKRALAIAVSVSFIFIGIAQGYAFSDLIVDKEWQNDKKCKAQLVIFYAGYSIISWFILLVCIFTLSNEPKHPPSTSSAVFRDDDILGTYRALIRNKQFLLLNISHWWFYVMIIVVGVNITFILKNYGYSHQQSENCLLI